MLTKRCPSAAARPLAAPCTRPVQSDRPESAARAVTCPSPPATSTPPARISDWSQGQATSQRSNEPSADPGLGELVVEVGAVFLLPVVACRPGVQRPLFVRQLGRRPGLVSQPRDLLEQLAALLPGLLDQLLLPGAAGLERFELTARRRVALAGDGLQPAARGHVGRVTGDDQLAAVDDRKAVAGRLGAIGDQLLRARVNVLVGQQGIGPAHGLTEEGEIDQPPVGPIEGGRRNAAHRRVERGPRGQQVALRRDAALLRLPTAVAAPDLAAGGGVHGVEKDALGGKDPGAEVGRRAVDQHARPHGPERDHASAAQHAAILRRGVELPDDRAVVGAEAVDVAVVGAHVDPAADHGRRQADRSAGDLRPADAARGRVEAVDLVVGRGAEEDPSAGDGHLKGIVEVYAVPLGATVPFRACSPCGAGGNRGRRPSTAQAAFGSAPRWSGSGPRRARKSASLPRVRRRWSPHTPRRRQSVRFVGWVERSKPRQFRQSTSLLLFTPFGIIVPRRRIFAPDSSVYSPIAT